MKRFKEKKSPFIKEQRMETNKKNAEKAQSQPQLQSFTHARVRAWLLGECVEVRPLSEEI